MPDDANAQELLLRMMGHEQIVGGGPAPGFQLTDPTQVDWGRLTAALNLTDDEVRQLQTPMPAGGPTLQERLESIRPGVDMGQLRLNLTGEGVEGRVRF